MTMKRIESSFPWAVPGARVKYFSSRYGSRALRDATITRVTPTRVYAQLEGTDVKLAFTAGEYDAELQVSPRPEWGLKMLLPPDHETVKRQESRERSEARLAEIDSRFRLGRFRPDGSPSERVRQARDLAATLTRYADAVDALIETEGIE